PGLRAYVCCRGRKDLRAPSRECIPEPHRGRGPRRGDPGGGASGVESEASLTDPMGGVHLLASGSEPHVFPSLLLALTVVILTARMLGALFGRLGHPPVTGAVVAGI